jgi:hypothetical protein
MKPYTAQDPKPFDARPGAMDAFKLPSIENGKRIEPRKPKAMLVGETKEKPIKGRDK